MEQQKPNVISKSTLFSWSFVATLVFAVFWATVVYSDVVYTQEKVSKNEAKLELMENSMLELKTKVIEIDLELKYLKEKIK
jgi:hypothetical protein